MVSVVGIPPKLALSLSPVTPLSSRSKLLLALAIPVRFSTGVGFNPDIDKEFNLLLLLLLLIVTEGKWERPVAPLDIRVIFPIGSVCETSFICKSIVKHLYFRSYY